jgi:hypothetical protein
VHRLVGDRRVPGHAEENQERREHRDRG